MSTMNGTGNDDQRWTVRSQHVTHERLDDEVIAIDLESGMYFAMVGPAADVWTAAVAGGRVEQIAAVLASRYGSTTDVVDADVRAFVQRLVDEQLLVPAPDDVDSPVDLELPERADDAPWSEPALERYDDMADLVLLDPIHQVDEAGWPHLPPEA